MKTTASTQVRTQPQNEAKPALALVLALLSVPGSTVAWYLLPAGGLLIGLPLGIAAIVLGAQARKRLAGSSGTTMATAAIVIAALALGQMVVYYTVEALA